MNRHTFPPNPCSEEKATRLLNFFFTIQTNLQILQGYNFFAKIKSSSACLVLELYNNSKTVSILKTWSNILQTCKIYN